MDKYIIINLNMFAYNNQVSMIDTNGEVKVIGEYAVEQLPDIISNLAHESEIYKVKIIGGSKYAQLVEFGINTSEMLKYNERKIEIEVI